MSVTAGSEPAGFRLTNRLAPLRETMSAQACPAACGLGKIFQLGPREAGLLVNLRVVGVNTVDFELGFDLVPFDDLDAVDPSRVVPLARNEPFRHPRTDKPMVLVKYPATVGFVPLGTRRADGTPHPHAGTGFSVGTVIGFPADHVVHRWGEIPDPFACLEVHQYRYDSARFEVTARRLTAPDEIIAGRHFLGPGLSAALPDGDDLLMPFYGRSGAAPPGDGGEKQSGEPVVVRWRRSDGAWRAVGATPVPEAAGGREPTMIRDRDGSLLLCARTGWPPPKDGRACRVQAWRSRDGAAWRSCLDVGGLRSSGPVALSRTAGGRPFIIGNTFRPGGHPRASLSAWPLTGDRTGIADNLVVFDADALFGPAPFYAWFADHPIGAVVRLADGRLHSLVAIRVLENTEVVGTAPPTPVTGCYLEEVFCGGEGKGDDFPVWP